MKNGAKIQNSNLIFRYNMTSLRAAVDYRVYKSGERAFPITLNFKDVKISYFVNKITVF